MSEHQVVAFRAIDAPVTEANLAFMRKQSTRAQITDRAFDNEYSYGNFKGNAFEMLRRGYDFHFHYTNFGDRTLVFRLPRGLPDPAAAEPYLGKELILSVPDETGPGTILSMEPYVEDSGYFGDDLWEFDDLIDRLAGLRAEILEGDLRPLYLAHLAMSMDANHDPEEALEAPVPAGLNALTPAQTALARFYALSPDLIEVASWDGPRPPTSAKPVRTPAEWLGTRPQAKRNAWLTRLVGDDWTGIRGEILSEYRAAEGIPVWATAPGTRTVARLLAEAEALREENARKAADKAARARQKKHAEMRVDPSKTVAEYETIILTQSGTAYKKGADLLAELQAALSGTAKAGLVEDFAQKVRERYPTRTSLVSSLKKAGFLQPPPSSTAVKKLPRAK